MDIEAPIYETHLNESACGWFEQNFSSIQSQHERCVNLTKEPEREILDRMEESDYIQRVVSIVVPILFGLIIFIGLVGNGLVVVVVLANQQMKSTTNYLILNLAIADLLFVVFCVPFTASDYALPNWPYGLRWCKTVQYLIYVTAYVSVYTLVLMSVDRFLAVVRPVESLSYRTERNAILACVLLWCIVLICCIPLYVEHGLLKYTPNYIEYFEKCQFLKRGETTIVIFQVTFFVSSYLVPLGVTCTLYMMMLFRLWSAGPRGNRPSQAHLRDKRRATRLVIVVVVIFAVCWFPIQLILLLKSLNMLNMNLTIVLLQVIANTLAYMNSCVNPILYAFLSESFRKAFRKVMPCKSRNNRSGLINGGRSAVTIAHSTNHPLTSANTATTSTRVRGDPGADIEMADCREVDL